MLGAIIGDIVGSRFEWHNHRSKEFAFFDPACTFTDDTVMTIAVAVALMRCRQDFTHLFSETVSCLQAYGRRYPEAGYGGRFYQWIFSSDPQPYGSYGNGAAMRVSACAYVGKSMKQVLELSKTVTEVTHNHPESLQAARAVAGAVFLARTGHSRKDISDFVLSCGYDLNFTLAQIRPHYHFDARCHASVPQALTAFFESTDFEDAIRNAVSIGGDSDTIAAISGSIAGAYYGIPENFRQEAYGFLDKKLLTDLLTFEKIYSQ